MPEGRLQRTRERYLSDWAKVYRWLSKSETDAGLYTYDHPIKTFVLGVDTCPKCGTTGKDDCPVCGVGEGVAHV